jgi:hypothetical protein
MKTQSQQNLPFKHDELLGFATSHMDKSTFVWGKPKRNEMFLKFQTKDIS